MPERDLSLLDDLVVRPSLPFREKQLTEIKCCINECRDAILIGLPGTGKTASLLYINSKLTSKYLPIYIRCIKEYSKPSYIFKEIIDKLAKTLGMKISVPKSGISSTFYLNRIKELINKSNQQVLLELDEIDLLRREVGENVILNLKRQLENVPLYIPTINKLFLVRMSTIVREYFIPQEIAYTPYTNKEILDILKFLEEENIIPPCFTEESYHFIAVNSHGDMRFALKTIKYALQKFPNEDKIDVSHIKKIITHVKTSQAVYKLHYLYKNVLVVLHTIAKHETCYTGELMRTLEKDGFRLSYSTLHEILDVLDACGYIYQKKTRLQKGMTTQIKLLVNKEAILQEVEKLL